ncbi:hypothetical protein E6C60_3062 [Paenibacillus algicola]|uniref:Uncharacterized protein n=1 Tax=Paenibacillus algicola TaxID=2565926 RepID=A0A4P8XMV6_9BACL|nr:hypothetical protein [Paenibacillus algicola]QCT03773.1 hypothetical protein E6C60_3062 [Paenibacillus algicola]
MRQITAKHLTFLQIAINVFESDVLRETHWNKDRDLIALRYGADRDCVQIFELGEEVGFFAQMLPATDKNERLETLRKRYGLENQTARPQVAYFSGEMEKQLQANEDKGGWETATDQFLKNQLEKNFRALRLCRSHEEYRRRCANIANYAMMLADNDRREEDERSGLST